jgi:hypothetical protein
MGAGGGLTANPEPRGSPLPPPEQADSTSPPVRIEDSPGARIEVASGPAWVLALVQIMPAIGLAAIAIVALLVGGIDEKTVALAAASGLAGYASNRGSTR